MIGVLIFVSSPAAGFAVFAICRFVLDSIHDPNADIVVSVIGLNSCFMFLVPRLSTSLLRRGWDVLSDPIGRVVGNAS